VCVCVCVCVCVRACVRVWMMVNVHTVHLEKCQLCNVQIDLSKMTDKLANEQMVEQRVLNEVNIHCDKGLRHPSIVRVCVLS